MSDDKKIPKGEYTIKARDTGPTPKMHEFITSWADYMGGTKVEREATNPEGGKLLDSYIERLESIRDSWNDAYDDLVAMIDEAQKVADEWNGKPTYVSMGMPILNTIKANEEMSNPVHHWGSSYIVNKEEEDGG